MKKQVQTPTHLFYTLHPFVTWLQGETNEGINPIRSVDSQTESWKKVFNHNKSLHQETTKLHLLILFLGEVPS